MHRIILLKCQLIYFTSNVSGVIDFYAGFFHGTMHPVGHIQLTNKGFPLTMVVIRFGWDHSDKGQQKQWGHIKWKFNQGHHSVAKIYIPTNFCLKLILP